MYLQVMVLSKVWTGQLLDFLGCYGLGPPRQAYKNIFGYILLYQKRISSSFTHTLRAGIKNSINLTNYICKCAKRPQKLAKSQKCLRANGGCVLENQSTKSLQDAGAKS